MQRREMLQAGGLALAGALLPLRWLHASSKAEVRLLSNPSGSHVSFDPVGLFIEPGQTVRWINVANVHTVTAYHPDNDNHALRIPVAAKSWDSGYLVNPGDVFEHRFEVPGVYDYYCKPHEEAGMVGRLVVGEVSGPGALPFDYFKQDPAKRHWHAVPLTARNILPPAELILQKGRH